MLIRDARSPVPFALTGNVRGLRLPPIAFISLGLYELAARRARATERSASPLSRASRNPFTAPVVWAWLLIYQGVRGDAARSGRTARSVGDEAVAAMSREATFR